MGTQSSVQKSGAAQYTWKAAAQDYRIFTYRSSRFEADIKVDPMRLVLHYPGLFSRIL
ncbi:putative glycolipid-binding domain-containing protein [Peribacillus sp. SCS-26]|uniref:putative glycolipid-binding domain-containing protein n=1 Tax=Paraperibacillus marinus TaxID=3115295 RepID=UPI0039064236